MAKVTLNVPGISCAHCQASILKALEPQAGIASVQVDIPAKTVRLEYDPARISLEKVGAILDDEGYTVASSQEA